MPKDESYALSTILNAGIPGLAYFNPILNISPIKVTIPALIMWFENGDPLLHFAKSLTIKAIIRIDREKKNYLF